MEILAQSSTAFALTHNFQGTQILGASCGRLSDSVASCYYYDINASFISSVFFRFCFDAVD